MKKKEGKGIQGTSGGGAKRTKGYNEVRNEEKRGEGILGHMGCRRKENEGVQRG